MSDIVDDLREYADASNYPATMLDAAAEIARLKAENERLRVENIQMQAALGYGILAEDERHIIPSNPYKCGTCDAARAARAENERLRAALDTANANCDRMASLAIDNAKDTERLRAALRRWEHSGCPDCHGDCSSANPPVPCCIMRETRAALTQQGGER